MITALAILGPTASGKSRLGMALATRTGGEIVSVDSRQAYRRLDIGTAKPTAEERRAVPHHLIDILDLDETTNAEAFARLALEAIRDIAGRGRLPILVGGSGLYFRSISRGFFDVRLDPAARRAYDASLRGVPSAVLHERLAEVDPGSARRIHPNDRYRVTRALEVFALTRRPLSEHLRAQKPDPAREEVRFIRLGADVPRPELHRRILDRARAMISGGWTEEVELLLAEGADPSWPGMKTLGYPEVVACVRGLASLEETEARIVELTRQYAKRQMTWFRKEPGIEWIAGNESALLAAAEERIRDERKG
jgi:tRNA dimethylallyltransferase